jgi:Na(+)-translocating NADH:ubiquinone oxidoreductase F subunit
MPAVELPQSAIEHRQCVGEITQTRPLTPTIREIRIRVPQHFAFRAGDYVQIAVPPDASASGRAGRPMRRAYSMANYPGETPGEIVLNVRLAMPPESNPDAPAGSGSTFLFQAAPGDTLQLYGPFGTFHASNSTREMVLIGGGAGMAPLRAIVLDQLRNCRTSRPISYWYGARNAQEMFYAEEFSALTREYRNFSWHPVVSGYMHEVFEREFLERAGAADSREYYLCGPPVMLDACRKLLHRWGVPDSQVFFDDFGS